MKENEKRRWGREGNPLWISKPTGSKLLAECKETRLPEPLNYCKQSHNLQTLCHSSFTYTIALVQHIKMQSSLFHHVIFAFIWTSTVACCQFRETDSSTTFCLQSQNWVGGMTIKQVAITDTPCQLMSNFIFKSGSFIELLKLYVFKFAEKGKLKIWKRKVYNSNL